MAIWTKALPMTASYLSPLSGFRSNPGYGMKLPVGLVGGFPGVPWFPAPVITG